MSLQLQEILREKKQDFKLYSPEDDPDNSVESFEGARGVIDFSRPEAAIKVAELASQAQVPLVCGTTGWSSEDQKKKAFDAASQIIPIVWDSNFSLGIEIQCQIAELLAKNIDAPVVVTDIHHQHKKDAPSGTALKLQERMKSVSPDQKVLIHDMRVGEVPGEHRLYIAWENEVIEVSHRANSRRAFAEGALKALDWASTEKPGIYRMKDVLK